MQVFIRFLLALAVAWNYFQCGTAFAAVTTENYGPYQISYYNLGDQYTLGATTYTGAHDWTAAEQQDIHTTISMWDNLIGNTPARAVELYVMWDDLPGTTLGLSSNPIYGSAGHAWSLTEGVWRENKSSNPAGHDVFLLFDSGTTWNIGSDNPTGSEIDFLSVTAHEIGHSLGFLSTYNGPVSQGGDDKWWSGGITTWDSYLWDAASGGNKPAVGSTGTPGNFNEAANPVYFGGANAVAANGGNRGQIYAPNTYASGSTLTHLNQGTYPTALMQPMIGYGDMRRAPTALEQAILLDLGWNIPEPSALALLLVGALCLARRRN